MLLSTISCRVPPVWTALQKLWLWMDTDLVDEHYDDAKLIGQRKAWWEDIVEKLIETSGWIMLT